MWGPFWFHLLPIKLGDEHYYAQELFEQDELPGYSKNRMAADKSLHEHVIYDSDLENSFAQQLEMNEAINVYAKLPGRFKIQTPLGTNNRGWAVLVVHKESEKLYFVVETRTSQYAEDVRVREGAKIQCGEAHFQALGTSGNPVQFKKATKVDELFA